MHVAAIARRELVPALNGDVVIEDRTAASLRADRGRLSLRADAFRARQQRHRDPTGVSEEDVWGANGELSIRLGAHLVTGAQVELGRTTAFARPLADPTGPVLATFGSRALVHLGWRVERVNRID